MGGGTEVVGGLDLRLVVHWGKREGSKVAGFKQKGGRELADKVEHINIKFVLLK